MCIVVWKSPGRLRSKTVPHYAAQNADMMRRIRFLTFVVVLEIILLTMLNKIIRKKQSKCKLFHRNSHMNWLLWNPWLRGQTSNTNCLSHVTETLEMRWHCLIHRLKFSAEQSRCVCCEKQSFIHLHWNNRAFLWYLFERRRGKFGCLKWWCITYALALKAYSMLANSGQTSRSIMPNC